MREVRKIINILYKIFSPFIAPSSPRNVRIISVQSTNLQTSWWEPARPNGVIQGYRLYFKQGNLTKVHQVNQNQSAMLETLTKLSKFCKSD